MKVNANKNKGITLIALVITIIVLLILAGVTIASLNGDNSILTRAVEGKEETNKANFDEKVTLAATELKIGYEIDDPNADPKSFLEGKFEEVIDNGDNSFTVKDNPYQAVIRIDGERYIVPKFTKKENEIYGKTYSKEILAYARNPLLTEKAEKYRKYFPKLEVEDSEEFLKIHANAVSNYLFAYARNPSLNNELSEIIKKLKYKGKISEKNYTPEVQKEYMKNSGQLMIAYARNPSLIENLLEIINKLNPFIEKVTLDKNKNQLNVKTKYDNCEQVRIGREEAIGDFAISYARNPSLVKMLEEIFNKFVPIGKNDNPTAIEQTGAVRAIGKTVFAYARNPSLIDQLLGISKDEGINILEKLSCLVKDNELEEVQIARAETLEILFSSILRNPSLMDQDVEIYNHYIKNSLKDPSPKVQAISLYNSGNLITIIRQSINHIEVDKIINNYDKLNIKITANTDEIQAASLANLGKLYYETPNIKEENKKQILDIFRTKLYKKVTSNSPIVQAAKYYSEGYYNSAYQKIMKIEDKTQREKQLKILEEIKEEFSPDIEIDYSLEEVKIAKIEFLNTIYDSYLMEGGRYFNEGNLWNYPLYPLEPSEEYFKTN